MYTPYDKGRWYRFFIESDGAAHTLVESDIDDVEISANYLMLPNGFHIVDFHTDINSPDGGTMAQLPDAKRRLANGQQGVLIPTAANYDWCYIWVFGYNA